eukprot:scaffold13665_cov73-Skeletonema_marinoi.AAC.2
MLVAVCCCGWRAVCVVGHSWAWTGHPAAAGRAINPPHCMLYLARKDLNIALGILGLRVAK